MLNESTKRIPQKNITPNTNVILPEDHPDLVFLNPKNVIIKGTSGFIYDKSLSSPLFVDNGEIVLEAGTEIDPETGLPIIDTIDMTDIESITFEEYIDPSTKLTKVNAIVKIRNGSPEASTVVGVDARLYDPSTSSYVLDKTDIATTTTQKFVTPTLSVPSVYFDRTGSAISWGWNDVTGFGSYSSISYEWVVTTLQTGGTTIDSGTINYTESGSYQVGNSGKYKKYIVSSINGDVPASASPRWLKVRAVVKGTNGNTYRSNYSNPI